MSDHVQLSPDELDAFASRLARLNDQTRGMVQEQAALIARLADSWKDPAFQRFADEFHATTKILRQHGEQLEFYVPKLRQLAERGRNVHSGGF